MLKIDRKLSLGAPAAVALLLCLWAPSASAVVVHLPGGQFLGVTPHQGISPASVPGSAAAPQRPAAPRRFAVNGNLDPQGSPAGPLLVLHSSAPYLIFWDPGSQISTRTRSLLARYFADVAADSGKPSNVYGVARQYYDNTGFADYRQTFTGAQTISDPQPYPAQVGGSCPNTSGTYPTCVSDAQEQAEISRLIAADGLPSGTGANAPIYFVITPPSVNVCTPNGLTAACADNLFCAYHSNFKDVGNGQQVLYAAIPMLILGAGQNPKGCQFDQNGNVQAPNGDVADVLIKAISHEDNETITDPTGTGWWDSNTGNEDGDNCDAAGLFDPSKGTNPNAFVPVLGGAAATGTLFNQLIDANRYYIQSEWSNGDVNCELRPSPGAVTASFTSSAAAVQPRASVEFAAAASSSTRGYSSSTWNFGDGSAPAFSPASGPAPISHVFNSPGSFTVTLTLVDTAGNLATAAHQVTVGTPPTASFTVAPAAAVAGRAVRFTGVGSGAHDGEAVTRYYWSFGDGSFAGGATPAHAYAAPGTYTATLIVADQFGLLSTRVSRQLAVDEPPVARAVVGGRPQAGRPLSFRGSSSSDPDGSIRSYRWSFGDGSGASGAAVTHTYRRPGRYIGTLTVSDSGLIPASTQLLVSVAARIIGISVQGGLQPVLLVSVNGAGVVRVARRSVALRRAGTAKFPLSLTSSQTNTLALQRRLVLTVRAEFTPAAGTSEHRSTKLTLRR